MELFVVSVTNLGGSAQISCQAIVVSWVSSNGSGTRGEFSNFQLISCMLSLLKYISLDYSIFIELIRMRKMCYPFGIRTHRPRMQLTNYVPL